VPLRPAQVHPHEHLRPVRGVDAARARRDREHGISLVVRSGELRLERRLGDLVGERRELARDVGLEGRVVERGELREIGRAPAEAVPALEAVAQRAGPLQGPLRALTVLPEVGARGLGLEAR